MMTCVAFGCASRIQDKMKLGLSFHRFPQDAALKQKWVDIMKVGDWEPDTRGIICSAHFKEEDIDRSSSLFTRLKKNAIPCTFPQTLRQSLPKKNTDFSEILSPLEQNKTNQNTFTITPKTNASVAVDEAQLQQDKTTFAVVSELFNEMNDIRRKVDGHLKRHRTKNCRTRSRIQKLKKSLLEVKEEVAKDNPILESLFENALKEPDEVTLETLDGNNLATSCSSKDSLNKSVDRSQNTKKECFGFVLAEELKNFSPEDFALLKEEIQEVLDTYKTAAKG